MNISVDNIVYSLSGEIYPDSSSIYSKNPIVSKNNESHIYTLLSYESLVENWDSYGARKPHSGAIKKAINFILKKINIHELEVFYTTPTPDGDILLEIKHGQCTIEFIFSVDVEDKIISSCNGDLYAEGNLNHTTFRSYLNWLYR